MPGSSNLGLWNYLDDDMLEPDYPVSTFYSWQLRDNLAHLIDSQCQVRVSWMGKAGRADNFVFAPGLDGFYMVEFPLTVLSTGHLPGLRVVSWPYSGNVGNTVTVIANLRWAAEPFFQTTGADSNALWTFTNTTTSTTGQKKTDTTTTIKAARNTGIASRSFSIEEGSDDHVTEMRMVRLEMHFTDSANDGGGLVGLQIIEFPLWP